ncbi:MAG: membrane protein insertion efficiency factor YidD [Candidatus Margulisiibacteriota bacterium]
MARIVIYLLTLYQKYIAPYLGQRCRYYPTCSDYTKEAVGSHGALVGSLLGIKRLIKCNQFFPGGFDPVPAAVSRETKWNN